MQEHIMPAQLYVREQQKVDPDKNFIIRVNNFPDLYEEKNILKFLKKKIPEFTHSKLVMEKRPQRTSRGKQKKTNFSGSVLIQVNHKDSINALLLLHGYRLQGYQLQSWLMGYTYEASEVSELDDIRAYEQMFRGMRQKDPNPETHHPKVKQVQSDQQEIKKNPAAQHPTQTTEEDEFSVTRFT